MKHQLILTGLMFMAAPSLFAQSYFDDDIYYDPKKDNTEKQTVTKKKKQSNYIANMADMDVDTYNRRNQYYITPVDTIGQYVENGEDFVYTQQIQKYYNPTIVVDNADVLADVLSNSYGNVDIEINNNGLPVFLPSYAYAWPYYRNWGFGPWGVSIYDPWYSWSWGPSWTWGPSWSWGPSWAWGPSWGWGPSWSWGPSWGWGPGWGHHHPPMANWRPNGNRPVGGNPGWSHNTRPGYGNSNRHPIGGGSRPGSSVSRPGNHVRPGNSGVVNNNGTWQYVNRGNRGRNPIGGGFGTHNSNTRPGNAVNGSNVNTQRPTQNNSVNRGNRGNSNRNNNYNVNRNNNNNNYNYNRNSNRSYNRGNNSGSFNRGGGSYNGGRGTTGGGSRGGRGRR